MPPPGEQTGRAGPSPAALDSEMALDAAPLSKCSEQALVAEPSAQGPTAIEEAAQAMLNVVHVTHEAVTKIGGIGNKSRAPSAST